MTINTIYGVELGINTNVGCVTILRIEMSPKTVMQSYKINTQNWTILHHISTDLTKVETSSPNEKGCKQILTQVSQWLGSYKTTIGNVQMGKIGYTLRIETVSGTVDVTMYNEDANGMMDKLSKIYQAAETEFQSSYTKK